MQIMSRIRMWWKRRRVLQRRRERRLERRWAEIDKMRSGFWRENWQAFNQPEWTTFRYTTWTQTTTPDGGSAEQYTHEPDECQTQDEWPDEIA